MKYGIYDTIDCCWLGNDTGPALFRADDLDLAEIARSVCVVRLGIHAPGRLVVRVYDEPEVQLRDSIPTTITNTEALDYLQGKWTRE